ncbi:unnamed protein product [Prorocentrum cordatum]|uniref:Uncharacterized protein n=1 Tax=Prorocentrum cordatum TaxID=2364126 RepID=A0ABN9Q7U6_9DINO|nr:unnamed protein product [Polarella glacialis]
MAKEGNYWRPRLLRPPFTGRWGRVLARFASGVVGGLSEVLRFFFGAFLAWARRAAHGMARRRRSSSSLAWAAVCTSCATPAVLVAGPGPRAQVRCQPAPRPAAVGGPAGRPAQEALADQPRSRRGAALLAIPAVVGCADAAHAGERPKGASLCYGAESTRDCGYYMSSYSTMAKVEAYLERQAEEKERSEKAKAEKAEAALKERKSAERPEVVTSSTK